MGIDNRTQSLPLLAIQLMDLLRIRAQPGGGWIWRIEVHDHILPNFSGNAASERHTGAQVCFPSWNSRWLNCNTWRYHRNGRTGAVIDAEWLMLHTRNRLHVVGEGQIFEGVNADNIALCFTTLAQIRKNTQFLIVPPPARTSWKLFFIRISWKNVVFLLKTNIMTMLITRDRKGAAA